MDTLRTTFMCVALLLIGGYLHAQSLTSCFPATGNSGQSITVTLTGQNTAFGQGTGTLVGMEQWYDTTWATNVVVNSATELTADFILPADSWYNYNVFAWDQGFAEWPVPNGFEVLPPAPAPIIWVDDDQPYYQARPGTVEVMLSMAQLSAGATAYLVNGTDTLWPDSVTPASTTRLDCHFDFAAPANGTYIPHLNDPVLGLIISTYTLTVVDEYLSASMPSSGTEGTSVSVTADGYNTAFSSNAQLGLQRYLDTIWATNVIVNSPTSISGTLLLPATLGLNQQRNLIVRDGDVYHLPVEEGFTIINLPEPPSPTVSNATSAYASSPSSFGITNPYPIFTGNDVIIIVSGNDTAYGTMTSNGQNWSDVQWVVPATWSGSADVYVQPDGTGPFYNAPNPLTISNRSITSATPSSAYVNDTLTVTLNGQNTLFGQGTGTIVKLDRQGDVVTGTNKQVISATELQVDFLIPNLPIIQPQRFRLWTFDSVYARMPSTVGYILNPNLNGTYSINGQLTQGSNKTSAPGDPVQFEELYLYDVNGNRLVGDITDADGWFDFQYLPAGTYYLQNEWGPNDFPPLIQIGGAETNHTVFVERLIDHNLTLYTPSAAPLVGSPNEEMQLQVFPNPFSSQFSIEVASIEGQSLTVRLFDLSGRAIGSQQQLHFAAGVQRHALMVGDIPEGLYVLVLDGESGRTTRMMMHTH